MISVQVDKLRDTAMRLEIFLEGSTDAIPTDTHEQLREAADTICKIQAENAKLRELADAVKEFVEDTHCEDCPCRRDCDDNNRIFCANDFSHHAFAAMRELGIEVNNDD